MAASPSSRSNAIKRNHFTLRPEPTPLGDRVTVAMLAAIACVALAAAGGLLLDQLAAMDHALAMEARV